MKRRAKPISTGSDWTMDLLRRYGEEIAIVAKEFGLDTYPNQIEIITSEQMLDAYASVGLPIGYPHWSYGKEFIRNEQAYRNGNQGLAYEIVINSNPCIAYCMEENSIMMQALVIAHASYGHNSFFKGNYLFRQWTDAGSIIDYMVFAKNYVTECEQRYGHEEVEQLLDSCHALMMHGVDRYKRPAKLSLAQEKARTSEREEHAQRQGNVLWRTVPASTKEQSIESCKLFPAEEQENLLYFIEKHAPNMQPWQREIVRITRKLSQYFYPQGQTKVMNEGWATFWHYTILNRLYDKGLVDEGFILEFLQSHTNVVAQRGFNQRGFGGINPYALGFAMFTDMRRICEHPTPEDAQWFPEMAGSDWLTTLDFAMRHFKDESFISQYLSPKVIRDFGLFALADHASSDLLRIDAVSDEDGYRRIRSLLSTQNNRDNMVPDIRVKCYSRDTDRSLLLHHHVHRNRPLDQSSKTEVMRHLHRLWGFPVHLVSVAENGEEVA
jgi:stage V sporulation protein R